MREEEIFNDIILGRDEAYDAGQMPCIPFMKGTDEYKGVPLRLGNMVGGFPVTMDGRTFATSEALFLCGEFSCDTPAHRRIQEDLLATSNGFAAKKAVKNKHIEEIRPDFSNFSRQWMLWVVWRKTEQNEAFRDILLRLPKGCVIIEDSSFQTSATAKVWGCKNAMRRQARKSILMEAEAIARIKGAYVKKHVKEEAARMMMQEANLRIGVYEGKNNMGKILMMCKRALENNIEPPIDKELLNASGIYLLGKRLCL